MYRSTTKAIRHYCNHCREGCDSAIARRGSGASDYAWISANLTDLEEWSLSQTIESIDSRVGDRGFWLQTSCALAALSYSEAEWLKGESRGLGREGSNSAWIRPSEKLGTGDRKLEKDAEGRGRSRGGKGGIYGRRESSETHAHARSPIGRPLNPGGRPENWDNNLLLKL
jgi:hypothetical protein